MSENNCIFCKVATKEINTEIILETEDYIAFPDINPQAPVHALIITKKHYSSLNDIDNIELLGKLMAGVRDVAKKLDIYNNYRIIINTGEKAGQSVFHVHAHVLGGRSMLWPPG